MTRILLVAPPWRIPHTSSLSLGTLVPILRAAGIEADELHGSLLFPREDFTFEAIEAYAKYLFVPALTGCAVEPLADRYVEALVEDSNLKGILYDPADVSCATFGIDEAETRAQFRADVEHANRCLELMLERALAAPYDLVGFSVTFDNQVPAALALAHRIRAARPEVKIVFGGAACFEEQADGLVASFPVIDAACHTDGEHVIVPLVRALRDGASLAEVPGIAWRDGASGEIRHNPGPRPLENLDELPVPDFRAFIAQFAASHWARELRPRLMFETSRGCWWGQKKLCSFCGLNAEGLAFRSKSPERAYEEIKALYLDYPEADYLQCTDNILDMKYLTTALPRLAELPRDPQRPLLMFYEVKSNMKPEQVEAMAAAGIDCVQPGIESFSDDVLKLMRKGCTALGQVQFIKWTVQHNIAPLYNVLLRNPGERAAWYREMAQLVPYLAHLPPPTGVVTMHLERFSPYFQETDKHGITNVRPRAYYHALYPGEGVDLDRIAYQFDYDHADHTDEELRAAHRVCAEALRVWRGAWKPHTLFFTDDGVRFTVFDRREGAEEISHLYGAAMGIFAFLDQHRSRKQVVAAFPALDPSVIDTLLLSWHHRRWVCRDGDRFLVVVPRRGPAAKRAVQVAPKDPQARVALPVFAT
ncbi:MAG: RiPP maturation radical SAM C-methyltransferase [Deltaproteobacteria bacterium]|nr:RiPP maturation radical SAM C-methyltransferase [Deltaproteobacteria bacterium]MCW5805382.1 RiPP maturation radical SAM C-methyltransferase [Deltaproteobacteria bacterium]